MNSLTLYLIGLALIYMPACLSQNTDKQCFSLSLEPSFPCCTGNKVVYTDDDGDWGVENNKWCGIGNGKVNDESCFSVALGYSCCEKCKVVYTDDDGDWGVEKNKWCGIKESCASDVDDDKKDFDFAFMKLENKKKNMIYSPLSIEYALKMLQEGAVDNTYTEISKLVGESGLTKYSSIGNVLSLANGLFIRDTYYENVKEEYMNTLKEKYDADIEQDKFANAQNINKWIEDKTLGIIKNMLKDEMVENPEAVMFIINALAVDVEWAYPFTVYGTNGKPFYKDDGEEMEATTMGKGEVKSKFVSYYKNDDITVLNLDIKDYNGTQLQFMAIMPEENLSGYVEKVSKVQIDDIASKLKSSGEEIDGVNYSLPKFKFDYDLELKDDLMKLGMEDSFNRGKAKFSKMSETDLWVSEALHKAEIEIAEKGVKAAAVTVIGISAPTAARPREKFPVNIIIDKPFLFVIRDKNTGDIWFTGTVYEPNKWADEKDEYEKKKAE